MPYLTEFVSVLVAIFVFMLGRITEAAKERGKIYPEAASKLLVIWRGEGLMGREAIASELMKLVMDNNPLIFEHIEKFWDAVQNEEEDASEKLAILIEAMRKGSIFGRVQYMFLGYRTDKTSILRALIEKKQV